MTSPMKETVFPTGRPSIGRYADPFLSAPWHQRWLEKICAKDPLSAGQQAWTWVIVAVLILGVTALVYEAGGKRQVSAHLMYIPILIAALRLGLAGTALTALAAGLVMGPFMPLERAGQLSQDPINWVPRLLFFLIIGLVASILFSFIQRSRQRYHDLVDALNEGFLSLDKEGRIVYANQKIARLLGYDRDELLGRLPEEFLDEENQKIRREAWEKRKTGGEEPYELTWVTRSGSSLVTRNSPKGVFQGDDFKGVFCVLTDLTEIRTAEIEKQRYFSTLGHVMDISPNIIFNLGVSREANGESRLQLRYVTENITQIMGYSPEDCLADPAWWTKHVHPEDLALAAARTKELFEQGRLVREFRYLHKNGEYRAIREELALQRDEMGLPVDIFGTWADVTDIRAAEEETRTAETKYRHLFENMTQGVVYMDREGIMVDVNPAGMEILGLTREQLLGLSYLDPRWRIAHEDGSHITAEEHPFTIALKTGRTVSGVVASVFHPLERQDRWVKVEVVPRFQPGRDELLGIAAIFTDITADKRREKELERLNRALTAMYGMNQLIIRAKDEPTLLQEVCRFIVNSHDYQLAWIGFSDGSEPESIRPVAQAGPAEKYLEELQHIWEGSGQTGPSRRARHAGLPQLIHDIEVEPDDQPWKEAALKHGLRSLLALPLISQGQTFGSLTIYAGRPEAFSEDEVRLLTGLAGDLAIAITGLRAQADLIKQEARLRRSRARYQTVVDSISDSILVIQDGVIKMANRSSREGSGYSEEEMRTRSWMDNIHPDDRQMVVERVQARLAGKPAPEEYSYRLAHKDGRALWMDVKAKQILWDDRPASLSITRDVTKNRELEEELRQAQKMEAIGVLAGGVAHDFNNLLQMIGGYTELVLFGLKEGDPGFEELSEVMKAVGRAGDLTDRLLTFGRKVESTLQPVTLNDSVKRVAKLLDRTLPKMIEVQLVLEGDLWEVEGDPAQMDQVLMNLAINARDAMPDGGRLTVSTKNVSVESEDPDLPAGILAGEYVRVSMSDTGTGMDKATRERIFDPFFTTKELGKGTGLGLSMIYGIVKSHRGYISCRSDPGQGATFDIYLPKMARPKEAATSPVLEEGGDYSGHETILLVDDEAMIRDFVKKVLTGQGYRVLLADSGERALKLFEEKMGNIDLVLLDMIMPGMGGKKCLERMLELKPEAKIIVASGYGYDDSPESPPGIAESRYLRKPFQMQELISSVRQRLEEGSPLPRGRKEEKKDV